MDTAVRWLEGILLGISTPLVLYPLLVLWVFLYSHFTWRYAFFGGTGAWYRFLDAFEGPHSLVILAGICVYLARSPSRVPHPSWEIFTIFAVTFLTVVVGYILRRDHLRPYLVCVLIILMALSLKQHICAVLLCSLSLTIAVGYEFHLGQHLTGKTALERGQFRFDYHNFDRLAGGLLATSYLCLALLIVLRTEISHPLKLLVLGPALAIWIWPDLLSVPWETGMVGRLMAGPILKSMGDKLRSQDQTIGEKDGAVGSDIENGLR